MLPRMIKIYFSVVFVVIIGLLPQKTLFMNLLKYFLIYCVFELTVSTVTEFTRVALYCVLISAV